MKSWRSLHGWGRLQAMTDTRAEPNERSDRESTVDVASLLAMIPFAVHTGIEIDRARPDVVEGRLPWAPERCTGGDVMHGGALMTLADCLGAVCAYLNLPEGAATTTIESKTNMFRAVREGTARGVSQPVHVGRSTIVVETRVWDDQDRLVALTVQTQAVLT